MSTLMRVLPVLCVLCCVALAYLPATGGEFFRGRPMPNRPGCETLRCVPMWDDELQRPFKRCYWRCRRPRPEPHFTEPEPPSPPDPPARVPQYQAIPDLPPKQDGPVRPELVFIAFAVVGIVVLMALLEHVRKLAALRASDTALSEAAEAAAAQAKLDTAAREADEVIKRQAARAFRRGRHSS